MTCILAAVCAIENAMELYVCKGAADGTGAQKLACCKGIFGLQASADVPRKLNPDSGVTGSGVAAETYDLMEHFLKIRCLCDDDIYAGDSAFFDEVLAFAPTCATSFASDCGGNCAMTNIIAPAAKSSAATACGTRAASDDIFNDFAGKTKDQMDAQVADIPKTYTTPWQTPSNDPKPRLPLQIMVRTHDVAGVKTTAQIKDAANAVATALSLADDRVIINHVSRGTEISARRRRHLLADFTIIDADVVPAAGAGVITEAEMTSINNALVAAQDGGLALGTPFAANTVAHVTYSLLLETGETEREALPKGRVEPLPTPESSELPAASTGLGRNGYEGGFEITNSKYIASVGYQGVPGIGMAIILAVVMILMLIVYLVTSVCGAIACKFCNGAYKPRAFTKKDLFQNKMVIIAFVVVTAVGAFIIFAEAPNLVSGASDLTQAMADTISDLADDVSDINSAMTDASGDPMMSMITGISSTTSALDDAAATVDDAIQKAQDDLDEYLTLAGTIIAAAAGVMFGVAFFLAAASFIGYWRLLIFFIVLLSLLMILAWLVWGVVSIVTVLVDDLCWAMGDYLANPDASDLGDLIPCMDEKTAVETMNMARSMVFAAVTGINTNLEDYAGADPYQNYLCYNYVHMRLDDLCDQDTPYYEQPYAKYTCRAKAQGKLDGMDAEDDGSVYGYADAFCPYPTRYYEVRLGDYGNSRDNATNPGLLELRCPFSSKNADGTENSFGIGQCYAATKIPSDIFDDAVTSARLGQLVIDIVPLVEDLLTCKLVKNAFTAMGGPCDDMATSLQNMYYGFLLVAMGYFLTWVSALVVVSRLQYFKTHCKDGENRYK